MTGRTKFPSAVSLTKTQIEWMRKQPNASELIGRVIDALMPCSNLTPEAFCAVQLHVTLENLKAQLSTAEAKRRELLHDNEWHFKRVQVTDPSGLHTDWRLATPLEPIDDDGRIALRVLSDLDASIAVLQNETQKVRSELLNSTEQHE